MGKGIPRTVEATGSRSNVVSEISLKTVLVNLKFQYADSVQRIRSMNVLEKSESVVRRAISDFFLEKKKVPTPDNILPNHKV